MGTVSLKGLIWAMGRKSKSKETTEDIWKPEDSQCNNKKFSKGGKKRDRETEGAGERDLIKGKYIEYCSHKLERPTHWQKGAKILAEIFWIGPNICEQHS